MSSGHITCVRTWEGWASCPCMPSTSTAGTGAWVWQPFLLAGTSFRAGVILVSKSARGLGPGRPDPGQPCPAGWRSPYSWGRSEPRRVGLQALLCTGESLGPPQGSEDPPRALRGQHSPGLSAFPNAWRVLSPASAKGLPPPTKSAQVENQASTVSPEPPGRLPQWTSPTGGTFQRGAGAAGFAIIPCKPREPSDTLSRI